MDLNDLNALSLTELRKLQTRVASEIQRRADSTRKSLLKRIKKMAEEEGLSFDEVMEEASTASSQPVKPVRRRGRAKAAASQTKASGRLPAKYFNPEDPSKNWSGRGRKPQWVIDWLNQGKPLEGLEKQS